MLSPNGLEVSQESAAVIVELNGLFDILSAGLDGVYGLLSNCY
jgi:hypothetical protein